MKIKLALSIVLLSSLLLNSCKTGSSVTDPVITPVVTHGTPTPVGTPIGSPSTTTIDATGGAVLSPDGRLEMIIPAGALSTATVLSIQPVTNEAPGGAGVGFSLTPNGQQFTKAVTLRFHYDSSDCAGSDMNALAVATQKDDQVWYAFNTAHLDPATRTLSVSTMHFSGYSLLNTFRITPESAEIKVNETQGLEVRVAAKATVDNDTNDDLSPLATFVTFPNASQVKWTMNGSSIGNLDDGYVDPTSGSSTTTYHAPAATGGMSKNPVTVTAEVDLSGSSKMYLLSNIKVTDNKVKSYNITMDLVGTDLYDVVDVSHGYTQHASFVATIYPDRDTVVYSSIANNPGQISDWKELYSTCTHTATSQGDFMHIIGFMADWEQLSPPSGQPVRIWPHVITSLTPISFTTVCGSNVRTTTGTPYQPVDYAPGAMFILDGTTQTLTDPTSVNIFHGGVVTFTLTPQ